MNLYYPLDNSQANARSFTVCIQLFEQTKNTLVMLRRDADAVVPDKEDRFTTLFPLLADLDKGRRLISHIFYGIV